MAEGKPGEAFRAVAAVTVGRTCAGRARALKAPRAAPNPTELIEIPQLTIWFRGGRRPVGGYGADQDDGGDSAAGRSGFSLREARWPGATIGDHGCVDAVRWLGAVGRMNEASRNCG